LAKRIYVSDWAARNIQKISREENIPMYMVVDKAIKKYLNSREKEVKE